MYGRKGLIAVIAVFLIALGGVGFYYKSIGYVEDPINEIHITKDLGNSINTYLHLVHYRDGEIVDEFWKNNDLLLSNYCNWTMMTLSGRTALCYLRDDQGQRTTVTTSENEQTNSYIAIGNGTSAVGFDNYTLDTETHREKIDDWLLEETGTSYNLTATSFFTFDDDYNITEVGWCYYHSDFADEVFLTRDTFAQQEMQTDDTLAVSVIMEYTGGITNNYGKYIADYLYGETDDQYNPKTEDGFESEVTIYWLPGDWYMEIGTGSGGFTLDDYKLADSKYTDIISDDDQVIYNVSGSDCNITVIGYFSIDATWNIYEIGLFTPRTDTTNGYMMCREVLGAYWSVSSGQNIAVYVTWVIDQP